MLCSLCALNTHIKNNNEHNDSMNNNIILWYSETSHELHGKAWGKENTLLKIWLQLMSTTTIKTIINKNKAECSVVLDLVLWPI